MPEPKTLDEIADRLRAQLRRGDYLLDRGQSTFAIRIPDALRQAYDLGRAEGYEAAARDVQDLYSGDYARGRAEERVAVCLRVNEDMTKELEQAEARLAEATIKLRPLPSEAAWQEGARMLHEADQARRKAEAKLAESEQIFNAELLRAEQGLRASWDLTCQERDQLRAKLAAVQIDVQNISADFGYEHAKVLDLQAKLAAVVKALAGLIKVNDEWNESVQQIIGRVPGWSGQYLDEARAALAAAREQPTQEERPLGHKYQYTVANDCRKCGQPESAHQPTQDKGEKADD
jgi:hypothetical protein